MIKCESVLLESHVLIIITLMFNAKVFHLSIIAIIVPWILYIYLTINSTLFLAYEIDGDGRITGADAVNFFSLSKLSRSDLKQVFLSIYFTILIALVCSFDCSTIQLNCYLLDEFVYLACAPSAPSIFV